VLFFRSFRTLNLKYRGKEPVINDVCGTVNIWLQPTEHAHLPSGPSYIHYAPTHDSFRIKREDIKENNFSRRSSLHCILGFLAGKYVPVHSQGEHMKTHNHTREKDKHCY
jgi:hypothetical protein